MKILVAIANHGTKNKKFLDRLIAAYRNMRHEVTITVLSDRPKDDLPSDIYVLVGAPSSNPWSLPFSHRKLFSEREEDFDLFIYTEDDTLIEERHVDSFLRFNDLLPDDEIPGFMRYETRPSGERSFCSVHSHYRWDTGSVRRYSGEVFASFTNEHSACYMLTRKQLRKAIDSGGFLVAPHEGVFDMLVSAATDPYTRCGLKRRIAISHIEDFLVHHLPNVYLDRLGIGKEDFYVQIKALEKIADGKIPSDVLVDPASKIAVSPWGIQCYPHASNHLVEFLAGEPNSVLSVGCTAGDLEREIFGADAEIVGIPLDSALGAVAGRRRIEVLEPSWSKAMKQVRGRFFDVVLFNNVLHRFPEPARKLRDVAQCLADGAEIAVVMPNYWHYLLRRLIKTTPSILPRDFARSGMHLPTWGNLRRWLIESGFRPDSVSFGFQGRNDLLERLGTVPLGRSVLATEIMVRASFAENARTLRN